jgi:DNA-binding MarR family transcriptional regulator
MKLNKSATWEKFMDRKKIELFRKNLRTIGILFELNQKNLTSNYGIPLDQFHMLFVINELGACSMIKLAEKLSMNKSKVSRAIDKLVKAGFVNREIDHENRRYTILTLTGLGEKMVQDINDQNNLLFENILSRLPKDKERLFLNIFDIFTNSFREILMLKNR